MTTGRREKDSFRALPPGIKSSYGCGAKSFGQNGTLRRKEFVIK